MNEKVIAAARLAYPAGSPAVTLGAVVHEREIHPEALVGIPLGLTILWIGFKWVWFGFTGDWIADGVGPGHCGAGPTAWDC